MIANNTAAIVGGGIYTELANISGTAVALQNNVPHDLYNSGDGSYTGGASVSSVRHGFWT